MAKEAFILEWVNLIELFEEFNEFDAKLESN